MHVDFLAIGELLADVMTTGYTTDLAGAKIFEIFQGGSPANVAANLKYMGKRAAIISCVGNDGIGKFLLNKINNLGLSDTHIHVSNTHPTSLVLVTRSMETPDFIAYRMADTQIQPVEVKVIRSAAIVHTTAFALSRQPARGVILSALKTAKKFKKVISVDWNFAPAIWGEDTGEAVFEKIMKLQPMLKVSLDDLSRFTGTKTIEEYKSYLEKYDCSLVCITCGKDGVWFKKSGKKWNFKETLKVDAVIDTTGAGDAFWSGFMCGHIDALPVKACIDLALKTAAEKIQKEGPLYEGHNFF